ncbi:MAG: electron transfer flavoprotein subunit beta [Legionellales bacterium RIFCSPHIGHO2_12_FULL_37_14]|nr:MAG: electron transfer flavoprotein subunit beta [Legionellales bacterium RIFCSPHIGHO2_12_FULL_37_14]
MASLVLIEPKLEALARAGSSLINAGLKLDQDTHVLVLGSKEEALINKIALIKGVKKVYWATDPVFNYPLAESASECILALAKNYAYIIAPSSTFGKNILPKVAAKLDVAQVSDVINIISQDTFQHPIYAGNAIETVKCLDDKKVLSIRTTAFDPIEEQQPSCPIEKITTNFPQNHGQFKQLIEHKSKRPELTQADRIVSGGRGLQNAENFKIIEKLADLLGAAIGASRAAVDAGFIPNEFQVGQTGKVVAPTLYIAIGISGAIQHLAGMKDAKVIVAINKDEDAPIFEIATYGLVGDLFKIVPELINKLS